MEFDRRLPRIPDRPLKFDSRSEYAIGVLLERFGSFLEFHPIVLQRELRGTDTFRQFAQLINQLPRSQSEQLKQALHDELLAQYTHARKSAIVQTYGNYPLIVCETPQQVYKKVIQVHSKRPPTIDKFVKEFEDLRFD
ncbi:hypothetical protein EB077_11775 [bacterium]|nr:hypothetical protein [bacterium]